MSWRAVGSINVHYCNSCHGIHLPGNTFREVRAAAALAAHQIVPEQLWARQRGLCCSSDGHPMIPINFRGVKLLACSSCFGLWLDRKKLEKIVAMLGVPRAQDLTNLGVSLAPMDSTTSSMSLDTLFDGFEILEALADLIGSIGN
ncbi:zf-TFIIB domain-containing protein [Oxalobacteraceae bacterium]|nr:zf-TFIIB domain-containing protein [Oxalobacteraceae bacterium]